MVRAGRQRRGKVGRHTVAVVTGASSGVGRAVARELGRRRARVGLIARGREGLEAAAGEIREAGGEAMLLPLDVADAEAVEAAAELVTTTWGGIDLWINDAMVSVFAPVPEITPAEFRRVTEVNYLGTVHGTLAALRRMTVAGHGTILQIGSALAYRSIPLQSAYCATKAAIRGFTDSLRAELAHDGSPIALTMVHLPAVNTPQFAQVRNKLPGHPRPVPPIHQPEVVARAILHAAEHPGREHWIGVSTIKAIIGQWLIPGWLDRYLGRFAWDAQIDASRPPLPRDNLYHPLPGDRGAHGSFDDSAKRLSPFIAAEARPRAALGIALLLGTSLAAWWLGHDRTG